MFRNVYGQKNLKWETPEEKARIPFIEEAAKFIKDNDIIAMHEIVNNDKSVELFEGLFNHSYNPSVYFCLPDGTQPVPSGIGNPKFLNSETAFIDMLKQLMEAYEEWKKNQ